jgi:hypothetical protein
VAAVIGLVMAGCPDKNRGSTTPPPGAAEGEEGGGEEGEDETFAKPIPPEKVDDIQRVFRVGRIQVEKCFHDLVNRKQDPKLTGEIILGVRIGLNPNPEKVWIFKMSPQLKDEQFMDCVLTEAKQWTFPTWGGTHELTTPKYELTGY